MFGGGKVKEDRYTAHFECGLAELVAYAYFEFILNHGALRAFMVGKK